MMARNEAENTQTPPSVYHNRLKAELDKFYPPVCAEPQFESIQDLIAFREDAEKKEKQRVIIRREQEAEFERLKAEQEHIEAKTKAEAAEKQAEAECVAAE